MSTGLNFLQARAISQAQNLHVRRASWADANQWFLCWRGLWWYFTTGGVRPVQATDYTSAELLATDWTTVPTALAACPIDPTIGSTGGNPPTPGSTSFAGITTSSGSGSTSGSGSPYGGGGGGGASGSGGGPSLPPTPDGKSLTVRFAEMASNGWGSSNYGYINTNQTVHCTFAGGQWTGSFCNGTRNLDGSSITWNVTVQRGLVDGFVVNMAADRTSDPDGGFSGAGDVGGIINEIEWPTIVYAGVAYIS